MSRPAFHAALDVGSSAVKAVALDAGGVLAASACRPIRGELRACLQAVIADLAGRAPTADTRLVAVTGAGARPLARLLDVAQVNDIAAACLGAQRLVPRAGAVLEIGGEHSKFIRLGGGGGGGGGDGAGRTLRDFTLNSACSAGTGAFLEQEAHRLDLTIERFAERAAASRSAVRIAGRCAVFAKTDIVHKHQNGVPLDDIAYALCLAMAQCVAGELIGARPWDAPLAFVGGVAGNAGMRRALREALRLAADALAVPDGHQLAEAIGAVLAARARGTVHGVALAEAAERCDLAPAVHRAASATLPRLRAPPACEAGSGAAARAGAATTGIVGIDIGSTSTNVAVVAGGEVLDAFSVPTRGQPLAAVRGALEQLEARHGELAPRAVGVTGSGRKLVAEFIGADFVVNEITAHAAGCTRFYPDADAVLDIGGQDSKFIRLRAGSVVAFEMNKVCSAGTGSFLEEMAQLLGLAIDGEFARAALGAAAPPDLGERCTVFMASEIARRLQQGGARADLAAGLAYAVVRNYLARVVGRHGVGERVVFQGGVASNAAVVSALRQVLGREVIVHRFNDTAGAIGVALLAAERLDGPSRFRGLAPLGTAAVSSKSFECRRCANLCPIHVTQGGDDRRFYSGGLCDEFEGREAGAPAVAGQTRPDLFAERERALTQWVVPAADHTQAVGVPRGLIFHEMLPFWSAFFARLGIGVVLSERTTKHTLELGAALGKRGTCLPLKIAYGHCAELIERGVRRLFVPSIASLCERTVPERLDHLCPVEQGWPYTARALFPEGVEFLAPRLHGAIARLFERDLLAFARALGAGGGAARAALEAGRAAQAEFQNAMLRRGTELLEEKGSGHQYVAVLARPYVIADAHVALRLKRVFDEVGLVAVPMDMLPDEPLHSRALNGMYWYFGKRVLQLARALRRRGDLPAVFLTSFACGPDSFIVHMLRRELGDVPVLELEVDEHSEVNGVHTRLEAFRYSLAVRRTPAAAPPPPPRPVVPGQLRGRRLLVPQMSDHAFAIAAAFRSCAVDCEVLPLPDEASIALGRMALGGGECLPCTCVVGDMLRRLEQDRNGGPPPAFFMVSGDGPCRLGQYPWLQRVALNERGHGDVPIFNASQDQTFYEQFGVVPAAFRRTAWRGMVAADLLFRKWRERRARAVEPAEADAEYRGALGALERCLERNLDLAPALGAGFDRLDAVPARAAPPAATIGVLGENYVRCNAAANGRIADVLEELGADPWFPSLCEWLEYTNWTARLHCRYERQPQQFLRLLLVDAVQHLDMARLERVVRGRLASGGRPSLGHVFRLAARYVPRTFEGETIVGIGRTIDLYRRGVGGVIHVAPFGCLVGGIVETLCERISEDLGGFPILCLQYDGRDTEVTASLLEGFVLRAKAWQDGRASR